VEVENQGKQEAVNSAIKNIEKQFGKGSIMRLGEAAAMNVEVISTGCLSLDPLTLIWPLRGLEPLTTR
jgi:RecA/RadA recombinase